MNSLKLHGWEKRYLLLQRFQAREGHCNVTKSHEVDGIKLGKWVGIQHRLKRLGTLDPEKQTLLDEIGIDWVLRKPIVPWEERFDLLKQFKKREGHCNVPKSHKEDGANLGKWVDNQRQLKKEKSIKPYRQKLLEDVGFEWVLVERRAYAPWGDILKQFKKREGHCNVPQLHKEDGATLGTWVNKQRRLKKMGKLDPDKETCLEEIGFEWAPSVTWDERFSLLNQFKKREGHCNVPQSHKEDGANLGVWVSKQRQLKRKETLDADRETRLEDVGFGWGVRYKV